MIIIILWINFPRMHNRSFSLSVTESQYMPGNPDNTNFV